MSDAAMAWARQVRVGKSGAKLVLLVLADRASPSGIVNDCTQQDIAEEAELTDRQVRQLLAYLEHDAEIIDRERRAGDGRGRQNDVITLAMTKRPMILGAKRRQPEKSSGCGNRKNLPQKNLPVGATGNLPQTPSKILSLQRDNLTVIPKGSPSFEALWALWKAKDAIRRAKRKPAFDVFERLVRSGVDAERILAGARAYLANPEKTKDGGQYMPDLFRWLRDEVWADWCDVGEAELQNRQALFELDGTWHESWGPKPSKAQGGQA